MVGSVFGLDGGCGLDALVWTSEDGRVWTRAEVPDDRCFHLTAMTHGADEYIAVGRDCDATGRTTGVFWRSEDARHWELLGTAFLGTVYDECVGVEGVGVTDAGIYLNARTGNKHEVFRSPDGVDWERVSPRTFGVPPKPDDAPSGYWGGLLGTDMVQVDPTTVVLAGGCVNICPVTVWRSGDGFDWTELGRFEVNSALEVSIAVGPQIVLAVEPCDEDVSCGGEAVIWVLDDDGSLRETQTIQMDSPNLAYAGDGYLLVGTATGSGQQVFVSPDGLEWTRSPADLVECRIRELIPGPSQVLVSTNGAFEGSDCDGLWLVDVRPA